MLHLVSESSTCLSPSTLFQYLCQSEIPTHVTSSSSADSPLSPPVTPTHRKLKSEVICKNCSYVRVYVQLWHIMCYVSLCVKQNNLRVTVWHKIWVQQVYTQMLKWIRLLQNINSFHSKIPRWTHLAVSSAVELWVVSTIQLLKLVYKTQDIAKWIGCYCTHNASRIPFLRRIACKQCIRCGLLL